MIQANNIVFIKKMLMKNHNRLNLTLLATVCLAPLLNILFDYYLLHQKPTIISWTITVITLTILIVFVAIHINLYKK